jgi:hypothetical protein
MPFNLMLRRGLFSLRYWAVLCPSLTERGGPETFPVKPPGASEPNNPDRVRPHLTGPGVVVLPGFLGVLDYPPAVGDDVTDTIVPVTPPVCP